MAGDMTGLSLECGEGVRIRQLGQDSEFGIRFLSSSEIVMLRW